MKIRIRNIFGLLFYFYFSFMVKAIPSSVDIKLAYVFFESDSTPKKRPILNSLKWITAEQREDFVTPEEFLSNVKLNHPLTIVADNFNETAKANMLAARGGFDPRLYGDWRGKDFGGKNYYNQTSAGVELPTWFGLTANTGYNWLNGSFIDPSDQIPLIGQANLGIEATLLSGLLMDDRRADFFIAKTGLRQGENNRIRFLNDLLFEAGKIYVEWFNIFNQQRIFQESVSLATVRYEGIREAVIFGDRAPIDSTEARIQIQDRMFDLNESTQILNQSEFKLINFNWNNPKAAQGSPITKDAPYANSLILSLERSDTLFANLSRIEFSHPEVQKYSLKQDVLETERRLKAEKMRPKLNVGYNMLGNGYNFENQGFSPFGESNFAYKVSFAMPLLFRTPRGELQATKIKMITNRNEMLQKRTEVENKILAYRTEVEISKSQIQLYEVAVDNYQKLYEGELERFSNGESSVFLINSRESKLIESRIKLVKLYSNLFKARLGLAWSAGKLPELIN
jgi:outer membrane protein TolC